MCIYKLTSAWNVVVHPCSAARLAVDVSHVWPSTASAAFIYTYMYT